MDYGDGTAAMGQAAIDAGTNTATQIGFLYPNTTATQRLTRIGVTPMIGVNDVPSEIFTTADAKQVAAWARTNSVGEVSWWSTGRDVSCAGTYNSGVCSGTANATWAYAKAFTVR